MKSHHLFPARFFAVQSDFSAIEFLRHDLPPQMVENETVANHSSQQNLTVLTRHLPGQDPQGYIKMEPLSKPARSTLLKSLHIPKTKTVRAGKVTQEVKPSIPASEVIAEMNSTASTFFDTLKDIIQINHEDYLNEIRCPIPPPPPVLPIPRQTPRPRLQRWQYYKSHRGAVEKPNYWHSPESDFAYPLAEPKVTPRPLSSRRKLHDPPRWFKPEPPEAETEHVSSRAFRLTAPTVPMLTCDPMSPRREVRGVLTTPDCIDFGDIVGDAPETRGIVLANTGTTPVHFGFSQIENKAVRIVTIPGVVFPGLKMTITVQIEKTEPQVIGTGFKIVTPRFEIVVPVRANVIGPGIPHQPRVSTMVQVE
jgi:hypothetical protein